MYEIFDRISETLGLYEEEDDELLEEEEPVKRLKQLLNGFPAVRLPSAGQHFPPSLPLWKKAKPEVKCRLRKSFFSKKNVQNSPEGKTISMPLAQKQVKVVVLEPANFDDSQRLPIICATTSL